MRSWFFFLFTLLLGVQASLCFGTEVPDLTHENYQVLSPLYSVPGQAGDQLRYQFGWTNFSPNVMSVQFVNDGPQAQTLWFSIRDMTAEQTLLLDPDHNLYYASETIPAHSHGLIWSGTVKNLKDSFSLKLGTSRDNAVDQSPVSILAAWPLRSRFTFTPTIDLTAATSTATRTATMTRTPTFTPTPRRSVTPLIPTATQTFTLTMTSTVTSTSTNSPTPCQTATTKYDSVFLVVGSSYAGGEGASGPTACFSGLTGAALKKWYPGTVQRGFILPATEPKSWGNPSGMPIVLKIVQDEKKLPIGYILLEAGPMCFYRTRVEQEDDCKGATLSEGITCSYAYQQYMDLTLGYIYANDPDVNLVVLSTPDSSGGAGHYALPAIYEAYRDRLFELKKKYPRMRIADAYTATKGHSEYFHHNDDDRDHPNDIGQKVIADSILEQFANWPYKPHQSKKH